MTHLGSPTTVTSLSPQKLFDSTLGADAASIDTGAILPGGYDVLQVYAYMRTTQAAAASSVAVIFNDDGSAIYDYQRLTAVATTVSGNTSLAQTSLILNAAGASIQSGSFSPIEFAIPSYAQTTGHKSFNAFSTISDSTAGNNQVDQRICRWRSTAAINRIKFTAGSGNLLAGSRLLVYGQ